VFYVVVLEFFELFRLDYIEYKRDTNGQLISYTKYMKSLSREPLYKGDKDNPNIPNPKGKIIDILKDKYPEEFK